MVFRYAVLLMVQREWEEFGPRAVENARLTCAWLGARFRTLVVNGEPGPGSPMEQLRNELEERGEDLVLLAIREMPPPGHWQRIVLSDSPVPIIVFPAIESLRWPPFRAILVPLSGEREQSLALESAIRLGVQLRVPVDLLHVSEARDASVLGAGTDELRHSYDRLIDELIAEASPFSTHTERRQIRSFVHSSGIVGEKIIEEINSQTPSLLVIEWKGDLSQGRAVHLQRLLSHCCRVQPALLIRSHEVQRSVLRVGNHF